nr:MAG TPA: helix-turn-helix domain protein [Caudoviricetes sp.]
MVKSRIMSKNRIENSLHREIEQLRKSIETLASFPDIDLAELYVAKKCAARILGVCYRTLERWYNSGYIDCIRIGGRVYFPKKELLRIAQLYEQGISTLSGQNRPQTLSELYAKHQHRAGRKI